MIQKLYEIFASTRSIKKTADKMNELGYRTKIGSKFNTSTTRLLLKNPVYCVTDEIAHNYFYENGGGVCAELSDLTVNTDYPPTTRPTKKNLRTPIAPSFLRNSYS